MSSRKPKPEFPPVFANSIECGAGIVVYGQRYLVVEMNAEQRPQGCLMIHAHLLPYEKVDPTLYYAMPKPFKRPRKKRNTK